MRYVCAEVKERRTGRDIHLTRNQDIGFMTAESQS